MSTTIMHMLENFKFQHRSLRANILRMCGMEFEHFWTTNLKTSVVLTHPKLRCVYILVSHSKENHKYPYVVKPLLINTPSKLNQRPHTCSLIQLCWHYAQLCGLPIMPKAVPAYCVSLHVVYIEFILALFLSIIVLLLI